MSIQKVPHHSLNSYVFIVSLLLAGTIVGTGVSTAKQVNYCLQENCSFMEKADLRYNFGYISGITSCTIGEHRKPTNQALRNVGKLFGKCDM